jgi:hypothetical protein
LVFGFIWQFKAGILTKHNYNVRLEDGYFLLDAGIRQHDGEEGDEGYFRTGFPSSRE